MFDLTGRVALVTGGSRGLGRAMVLGLATAGADVVIASRKLDACAGLAEEVRAATGRRALPVACHVGRWADLHGLVDAAYTEFGQVDILVNNAGMSPRYEDVTEISEDLWDKVIDVNLRGPFLLTALIGSRMAAGNGGSVINISSAAARRPRPDVIPYAAAKAGVNAITVGFAHAFGLTVRVNCISPGTFLTSVAEHWDLVPDVPINEGTIRAVNVLTEPGTICHALTPAPTSSGHMETGVRVMKAVTGVLAKMQAQSSDAFVREHVMSPWHDCWPGGVFYAPLESGDLVPFLDMHGGSAGGGAQPIADGMDASAALCQPQSSLPDIEVNEFQFPVLYLWRRINAGSGGAGRMRGGQGLDLAWTPWYTAGGQEHVFVSCWQVPPSGTQGGYPGSASGFDVVSGAGADRLLAAGSVPDSLDQLEAEVTPLDGKQFAVPVGPGDVVHLHSGGGGGLGDPLDRDLSRVKADLTDELLGRGLASEVYGVQFDTLGQIDEQASVAKREQMRQERRRWAADPAGGDARVRVTAAAARLAQLGGWCQPRGDVHIVERADGATGTLLDVSVQVTT